MPNAQPGFFHNLKALGAVPFQGSPSTNQLDPIAAARERFVRAAEVQMKMIEAATAKGHWFRQSGDAVIVTLKNGITAINREAPSFALASDAQAIKFIKAAKDACARGEFDELLLATNRPLKKMAEAATSVVAPQAQASVQPAATRNTGK